MGEIIRIGVDTSKSVFVLHGVDAAERPVLRKKLRRRDFLKFFAQLPPTKIGLEACGGAHYWARELIALGHEPKLLPAQHVKPYVQRNKNDTRDADAVCEAMSRPRMTFVRVKSAEEQAAQMLMTTRQRLVGYARNSSTPSAVTRPSSASPPPKDLLISSRCWRALPKTEPCPRSPKSCSPSTARSTAG